MYCIKHCILYYGIDQWGITIHKERAVLFNTEQEANNKLEMLQSYFYYFDNFNVKYNG